MNYHRLRKDEFLYQCDLRVNNSINDPEIASRIALFGYGAEKMNEGKLLYDAAVAISRKVSVEYADMEQAFEVRDDLRKEAHGTYAKMIQIGKVALKNDTRAHKVLEIYKAKATRYSSWLTQTRSFYNNLISSEEWMTEMAKFGMSAEKINAGKDLVDAVERQQDIVMREKGEAQNATAERDHTFDALADWINDYEVIAKIALADAPQYLEKLGIVVKN